MALRTFRTSNRHSLKFKMRMRVRRARERVAVALLGQLHTSTRAAA